MARPESAPKTPLAERLRAFRRELGDPERDAVAARVGVSKSAFASYERGESEPTASALDAYRREFNLNVRWLLTGMGPMFDAETPTPPSPVIVSPDMAEQLKTAMEQMTKVAQNLALQSRVREPTVEQDEPKQAAASWASMQNSKYEEPPPPSTIKFYPLYASAGAGLATLTEPPGLDLDIDGLCEHVLGVDPRHIGMFRVRGDSMLPTMADGDIVLADRNRSTRPIDDSYYLVSLNGELLVKRAEWQSNDTLQWQSDNNLPQYAPIEISRDELHKMTVVGMVVWIFRAAPRGR